MTTVQQNNITSVAAQRKDWRLDFEVLEISAPADWDEDRVYEAVERWLLGGWANESVETDAELIEAYDAVTFYLSE